MKYSKAITMLEIIAISEKSLKKGNYKTLDKTFKDLRKRIDRYKRRQNEIHS